MDNRIYYIYKIINTINNKIYIGQTVNPSKRWYEHRRAAASDSRYRQVIAFAIQKYGNQVFEFNIIAQCNSLAEADALEQKFIIEYDSCNRDKGYNISPGGSNGGPGFGHLVTEEGRVNMSLAQKGIPKSPRSDDYYDYLKDNKHAEGMEHTEEWKEMMRNREHSAEEKLKRSESLKTAYADGTRISASLGKDPWNKGSVGLQVAHNKIHWTPEQIEAIKLDTRSSYDIAEEYGVSAYPIQQLRNSFSFQVLPGNTGKAHSDETRQQISRNRTGKCMGEDNHFYGKSHTEEAREKNRLAHLGKCKYSPEQIMQMKEMVQQGISMQKVAEQFNCSAPTVKRMLNK